MVRCEFRQPSFLFVVLKADRRIYMASMCQQEAAAVEQAKAARRLAGGSMVEVYPYEPGKPTEDYHGSVAYI